MNIKFDTDLEDLLQYYDKLILDERGIIKLESAKFYQSLDYTELRFWCICRAIYLIPTTELITWLKINFNLDKAIEIGAGNNYLFYHLGIKGIDNYSEQIPRVRLVREILGEAATNPPPEVERIDAIAAVDKYQPETVIASWMTLKTEDPEDIDAGHKYAPDEVEILERGVNYVFIGNEKIHDNREILNREHQTYYFDWLVSRAKYPEKNLVYVWKN